MVPGASSPRNPAVRGMATVRKPGLLIREISSVTRCTLQSRSTHRKPVVVTRFLASSAQMSYSVCRDPESGSTIRLAEHYSKYGFVVAEDLLPHTTVQQHDLAEAHSFIDPAHCIGVVFT
jgi:hypothetical protein